MEQQSNKNTVKPSELIGKEINHKVEINPENIRVRARVGKDDKGNFYFTLSLWNLPGTHQYDGCAWTIGPFEKKSMAESEMKRAVKLVSEGIMKNDPKAGVIDMNDKGKFKPMSYLDPNYKEG